MEREGADVDRGEDGLDRRGRLAQVVRGHRSSPDAEYSAGEEVRVLLRRGPELPGSVELGVVVRPHHSSKTRVNCSSCPYAAAAGVR